MEKEMHKILRCPICIKGRIADVPSGAILSQYYLFDADGSDRADLIAKCPKCGRQVGITIMHQNAPPTVSASIRGEAAQT